SEKMSLDAAAVTSTTARLNASSFALDGLLKPLSLRTNCKAEARISASVAGGSKLNSVLMLRHMSLLRLNADALGGRGTRRRYCRRRLAFRREQRAEQHPEHDGRDA